MNGIGARLKKFRTQSKIRMPVIAKATGISINTLYFWENGHEPRKQENYFKLVAYLDNMEAPKNYYSFEIVRLPLKNNKIAIPHFDDKAINGIVVFNNYEPELIVEQVKYTLLGETEGLITINDNNMEPVLPRGCRIAITRLNDFKSLEWGKCYYIIDKNWQGYVKRVYQGSAENCISLVSDHPDKKLFPSYELTWDDIKTILKIVSCIIKF